MYASDVPFPVYSSSTFFSDRWDPLQYGRRFDATRTFFNQIADLLHEVPHLGIVNKQTENSEYSNYSYENKNCYLTFASHFEEDCMYESHSTKNKTSLDFMWLYNCELVYECIYSSNCYRGVYLDRCDNCSECWFSRELKSCSQCLFCANLRHKQYHIFNEPCSPEEYTRRLAEYELHTHTGFENAVRKYNEEVTSHFPVRALNHLNVENCSGDTIANCKNLRECFFCADSEDCTYSSMLDNAVSSMDLTYIGFERTEASFELVGCHGLFGCIGCIDCWFGDHLLYCHSCFSCSHCFGCCSLNRKSYCVFNRQYSESDYEALVPQIIERMREDGEWGEFFPSRLSPFAYNESVAQDWYPLGKNEVQMKGYRWLALQDIAEVENAVPAEGLENSIEDVTNDILSQTIICAITRRPFRLNRQELEFYRKNHLPLPRIHPKERHVRRISRRNPCKLWERPCARCNKQIQTSFAPDRPETVYCTDCYLEAFY